MQGTLSKWTNVVKGWQYRYFVLDDDAGLFSYYTSRDKMIRGSRRGCVRLRGAVIGIDDEDDATFTITVDGKTFHFQAKDSEERETWIRCLEDTVLRHNQTRLNRTSRRFLTASGDAVTMQDFDKKLAEADSYLELLLEQLKSPKTPEAVSAKAAEMAESVKHAVVLLQIAKNACDPPEDRGVRLRRSVESCEEVRVPEVSYSSSDDDDDFFDAEEEEEEEEPSPPPAAAQQPVSPMTPVLDDNDESIDFDVLYADEEGGGGDDDDDDEEEENVDMKSHGSVITHLLSQVRIGMDLTKIVLPTFILERRSLLEMYSDFFAHPDVFVAIAKGATPEERMVRVLRWYLSSFHAGRKSAIAKKPYNPILGETFRCHWSLPGDAAASDCEEKASRDGELPWCVADDLTFVAEQVSHHPPISAFHAEHARARIAVNAHIYTKSSFLGMSIAVHHVGRGVVRLLDRGEEYVATFPSAFCRSILTVPWIELGGKVGISCAKTGYSAAIEFKCKQFFSSDVNKLAADVFAPNSKKSLLRVEGEWNGKMMAKWPSGKMETFIDVNNLPIHRKQCKLIADQQRFESRRLWKNVTYNLKKNNIGAATAAKFGLEQRQRDEALARKEYGAKWQTLIFDRDDGGSPVTGNTRWSYKNPLDKRIAKHSSS